ncbi:protein tyrosine phosphatase family protein, partial [Promineifilum sp.]|uniref:protein tyrosine phosphatase family protein n=1 Tax=Promineifilum sp. TaxID=2664178 RepID=UPI0035B0B4FA
MSTEGIFNYVKVNDRLSTAGQPTEEQLRDLAADGFTAIINLVPVNPPYTPADEAGLARELGMAYHYIPVDWNNPTDEDFAAFERAMAAAAGDKTLIHCAANFRVTAFYAL